MGETGSQTIAVDGETYEYDAEEPWRDADLLETLYWDRGMSQQEVGDAVGCSDFTVSNWMDKLGVDARLPTKERPPSFYMDGGYEKICTKVNGKSTHVSVHRLLAIAEYGFDAVCGKDVHHKNHIPWDNRAENIELKTSEKHHQDHQDKRHAHETAPWRDKEKLQELYIEQKMSTVEIAEKWGCSEVTVHNWLNKHGIETRSLSEAIKLAKQDTDQQTLAESAE